MKQLKHCILAAVIMLMSSMSIYGQADPSPHRDSNENCVLKLEYVTFVNNAYVINVINKQECPTTVLILWQHQQTSVDVGANSTVNVSLPGTADSNIVIWAKTETRCNPAGCFDNFWVQLKASSEPTGGPLGIKFKSIRTLRVDANTIKLSFDVEDIFAKGYYNIKVSKDGINWRTVTVVFPDDTKPNNTYSVTIKLK
jgi:hypothetical protein